MTKRQEMVEALLSAGIQSNRAQDLVAAAEANGFRSESSSLFGLQRRIYDILIEQAGSPGHN